MSTNADTSSGGTVSPVAARNGMEIGLGQLECMARDLRVAIVDMIHKAGSGHPGGSLSICEILSTLYFAELCVDPEKEKDPLRDRFILSKGHAAPALYGILAKRGFFPEAELDTLRKIGSRLQGHPDSKHLPGVDISSGSLGMGISFGVGCALAARLNGHDYRTYVLTGCGELDEGQNWEGLMAGAKYGLDNLLVIVDYNKVQLDGTNEEILPLGDLLAKLRAFNWNVLECDGHSARELMSGYDKARATKDVPTILVAHTVKGKGVSFMEHKCQWHGMPINTDQRACAMAELQGETS